ncbi:MAG: hypothetical protein ACPGVY_17065 [Mycobacterium sp.]
MSEDLGSWVCLYDDSESHWTLVAEDEPRIDAAVSLHISSGGTHDTLLDLTGIEGFPIRLRASTVTSWFLSTPESRLRSTELTKLQADESAANRAALGLWDDE